MEGAPWGSINFSVCVCIGFILQGLLLQLDKMLTQRLFLLNRQLGDSISVAIPSLHQFPWSKGRASEPRLQSSLGLPRHSFTKGTGRPLDGPGKDVPSCWHGFIQTSVAAALSCQPSQTLCEMKNIHISVLHLGSSEPFCKLRKNTVVSKAMH